MNRSKLSCCRIGRIVLLVLISIVIGLSVYTWNANNLTGNKLPMPFGYGAAVVLSGSMEPELSVDDLVFIKVCDTYAPDDVVVYQSGNILVIHRIIEIDGETVTTKGDANNVSDDPIPASAIKGKMIGKLGGYGRIWDVLRNPAVILVMIFAAVLLLLLSYRKEKQADDAETDEIKKEIAKIKAELESGKERGSDENKNE